MSISEAREMFNHTTSKVSNNRQEAVAHDELQDELEALLNDSEVPPPTGARQGQHQEDDPDATEQEEEPPTNDDFAWMKGLNKKELMEAAVARVEQLGQLDKSRLALVCIKLNSLGVAQTWIDRHLRPLIKAACPRTFERISWRHYIDAATDKGYSFRINDMNDSLECNGKAMTDVDDATLLSLLHEEGLGNAEVARRAFVVEGSRNRYHPIKQYLEGQRWDGQDHITSLCSYFTDVYEPIIYSDGAYRGVFHAVIRRWLIGAVAKIYIPDKAQNIMPILDGVQNKGKSTFVQFLCPLPELFIEKSIDPGNKDFDAFLVENWVWEVPELGALMRKTDREALKGFLTTKQVKYRPPYARKAIQKPATASFIGTVNFEGALLSDPTGHRRFFPIKLTAIDHAYSDKIDIHQVWAQAMVLFRSGEPWRLCPEEVVVHASITETYEVENVLEGTVYKWFDITPGDTKTFTYTADIIDRLRLSAGVREQDKALSMSLSLTLHRMGLTSKKRTINGRQGRGYYGIAPNLRVTP